MTDLLLEATGIAKRYGGVAALRDASLSVRPGEVHALLGANGAGKSTLVKILTGAVRPDDGTILVRGQSRDIHSPSAARRSGLVSVYQEPALIPDLPVADNLRLTDTPMDALERTVVALGDRWSSTAHFLNSIGMEGLAATLSQLDVVLAATGIAILAWIGFRKGLRSAELAVVAIIIFQTATIVLTMRVDFERYYLPILLGEVVAIGSIVGVIAGLAMSIGQTAPHAAPTAASRAVSE